MGVIKQFDGFRNLALDNCLFLPIFKLFWYQLVYRINYLFSYMDSTKVFKRISSTVLKQFNTVYFLNSLHNKESNNESIHHEKIKLALTNKTYKTYMWFLHLGNINFRYDRKTS